MVPRGRLWDGYWVAKVSAGDFVGLSTMLNIISKVQSVLVTGSRSSCASVLWFFRDELPDLRKRGSGTRMGWVFSFIYHCWWPCGVINHAEQHIQRWKGGCHGFMMNIDLVVNFIVVEWRIAWNGERESLTWFVFDKEWAYWGQTSCDYYVFWHSKRFGKGLGNVSGIWTTLWMIYYEFLAEKRGSDESEKKIERYVQ